ncbi:MAG: opacity protein-like surface antigen [Parasphingorhabdus sp.]|jgi:opacity protein-like surface antigen
MAKSIKKLLLVCIIAGPGCLGIVADSFALGPLDGEVGVFWWSNQTDSNGFDEDFLDNATLSGFAEAWWNQKWGVKGSLHRSDMKSIGLDDTDHFSIDLKRRFFSLTDNSFMALGAGWEEIDLGNGIGSSSGPRLTAEGRVGLGGVFSFYGQTSWLPDLGDAGNRSNLEGREIEAGLSFDPAPFMSLRLGYRRFRLDFDNGGANDTAESDGFILGAGIRW